MKSPHKHGTNPYEDRDIERNIYEEEERLILGSYKFLGWNPTASTVPEYRHCVNEAHNYYSAFPNNGWKTKQHVEDDTDHTFWCIKDRIYWKVDMSHK